MKVMQYRHVCHACTNSICHVESIYASADDHMKSHEFFSCTNFLFYSISAVDFSTFMLPLGIQAGYMAVLVG